MRVICLYRQVDFFLVNGNFEKVETVEAGLGQVILILWGTRTTKYIIGDRSVVFRIP